MDDVSDDTSPASLTWYFHDLCVELSTDDVAIGFVMGDVVTGKWLDVVTGDRLDEVYADVFNDDVEIGMELEEVAIDFDFKVDVTSAAVSGDFVAILNFDDVMDDAPFL